MAGPTTAERGTRQQSKSGPPGPPRRPLLRRLRPPRPRLPRGRALLVLLAGTALLAGGGAWLLYGSQWLRVDRVTVSGARVLTADEVRTAAAVPVGSPLISVDTGLIEERLRQKLPRIDSVDVVRSWPQGIGLKVVERVPVLIVEKGGKFIEVDADGVRFATVSEPPKGVPTLELAAGGSPSLRRFGTDRLVLAAVRVAGDLPAGVARDTLNIKVRSYDSLSLELNGGRTIDWGSSEKGEAKRATLTALMKAAPKARHFDVSVPTAPASSGS
ncbi:cell division protein FtsQ/DivIB [Streptomyces sp. NPDC091292]|uniref:cell division protein FtsQ/DivIB n=1 Tax=Streptomyces sp. NPDC091292 TaxID=3365991 RepID=UPI003809E223